MTNLAALREVRRFAQEFFATMPDEAMIFPALVTTPDGMPAAVLLLGYSGPLAEGERVLAPARCWGVLARHIPPFFLGVKRNAAKLVTTY